MVREVNIVNITDSLEKTLIHEIFVEVDVRVKMPFRYIQSTSFITDTDIHVNMIFLREYDSGLAKAKSLDEVYLMHTPKRYNHPNAQDYWIESIKRAEKLKRSIHVSLNG